MSSDEDTIKKLSNAALVALSSKGMPVKGCRCPPDAPEVRVHLFPKYTGAAGGPNSYHPYISVFCKTCGFTYFFHARTLIGKDEFKRIVKTELRPRSS
jgi:hypothetical protein